LAQSDLVVDESAEEDHGDGEVGDADPVHDESAEENTIVLSMSFNWIIEGVEELDEGKIRHMNASTLCSRSGCEARNTHPSS